MRVVLATALLLAASLGLSAEERGFPLIETFEQRRHGAGAQIFDVTQSADGMLYFGGLKGVTTYDGAWWKSIELPNRSAVFAIESGRGPEIAVGAVDEFGWVAPDATGAVVFHSLRPHLAAEQQNFGDVRAICTTTTGFLFVAEQFAFAWSGGAPAVAADFRARSDSMPRCFRSEGTTYVALSDGLLRYDETSKQLVRAGFDGKKIDAVLPFGMLVRGEGVTGASTELNEWLRDKTVTATATLPNDRTMIGTRQDGIAILGRDGAIEQRLDTSAGLPGHVLTGALVDREGALWLSYYGVIARIDLQAPVTIIDTRRGLRGAPSSVERHRGRLYITSSHGLFVDRENGPMQAVAGVPGSAWHALSAGEDLLVCTREGVFVLRGDAAPRRIDGTESITPYSASPSKRDPSRIWLATKKGIGTLRRGGAGWTFEGVLPNSPPHIHSTIELGNELWATSVFDGAVRVTFDGGKPRIERYGSGERQVALVDGAIAIAGVDEILQPAAGGKLVPHAQLGHIRSGDFFLIAQDAHGNVWINSTPPQLARRDAYTETLRLGVIDTPKIQTIEPDGDVVWLISSDVVFRWDATAASASLAQPAPMIRHATADDRVVTAPLPPSFGRLRIEFAPASYRPGVVYQYRLDPVDAEWSAWTAQPSIDYTNLDHGDYTFRVRARGAAGAVSAETRWPFQVLPPWYRTPSALVLWLIAGAIAVALIVRLRTNALRRQAERLRALVDERTEALRDANAHLERLSLLDELTGIANRRYFQRALVEDWRAAHEQRQPLALIFFDIDHFKSLNDRYGHAAGDAALVQVARHLARRSRRSGDFTTRTNELVARIGGEEFALLLTHTTEEEAMRVADTLRAGIERLPLALTGRTVHITMSAGVAAMVPVEHEGWSALMREADRALYDAKADGRNCVKAAGSVRTRTDAADNAGAG
jgi:diguanylate cyclase (GGDEF)-like protein